MMSDFSLKFHRKKPVFGMVHVQALPGTPMNHLKPDEIINKAVEEALIYQSKGISQVIIENMHDRPYCKSYANPEIVSMMAIIGREIKQKTNLVCGIQILAGANKEAIAVAQAAGLDFIRCEGFVFGHVADEGYIDADAADLLRYRKQIGADNVLIFTDIKKKHCSHAITSDLTIEDQAMAAEFFLSDGIIITGKSTGLEADVNEVKAVKRNIKLPVIIGSGIDHKNLAEYFPYADGFIVGSHFKTGGYWANPLDINRIESFMDIYRKLYTQL